MKGRCVECPNFVRDKNNSFYNPKEQACSYHEGYTTHNALRKLECVAYQYEGDMEILDAKISWMFGAVNDPSLYVLVDRIPRQRDLIYKRLIVEDSLLLFAESRGYVSFMCRNRDLTKDTQGFGGMHFKLNVFYNDFITTTEIEFNGAWSSRGSVMNLYFNPKSLDVGMTENKEGFNSSKAFMGGNLRLDLVKKAIKVFNDKSDIKVELVQKEPFEFELGYLIKRADIKKPCKTCKGFGEYVDTFRYRNKQRKPKICRDCAGTGVKLD